MRKLLLTSGQVQVLLSSAIVGTLTFLLFLGGYVVQQRTVRGLQETLKPRIPIAPPDVAPAPASLAASLQASRAFGGSIGSKGRIAFQDYQVPQESVSVDWRRLAHVQLVKDHRSVCNAIMLFGELHRLKSPARRVLLFPKAWAMEKRPGKGETSDPYMESTRRLLRKAARRYRVELRPISPLAEGANEDSADSYSLASVYALADIERAMILSPPGLIQDATPLDSILAYAPASPLAVLQTNETMNIVDSDLLLVMPAADSYAVLKASEAVKTSTDVAAIQSVLPDPLVVQSSSDETLLVRSIGTLHNVTADFNKTAFLSSTAYIRFSDPKLPGPEFEVPYSEVVDARPGNKDADWVWTKLYGDFAQERYDICGLYLDPWR